MYQFFNLNIVLLVQLLVIAVSSSEDNDDKKITNGTNFLNSFNDVEVEYNEDDPCEPMSTIVPDFRAPGRRISEVKCFEHVWRAKRGMLETHRTLDCEHKKYGTHWLIGGHNARLSDFAHMGALGWKTVNGTWMFKCGGSLISNKFVLTAAHCASAPRSDSTVMYLQPKIVRLGVVTITNDRIKFLRASDSSTDTSIKQIIKHPEYRSPRRYYDIALVELEKEVDFQWVVHPACLHTSFDMPNTAYITGWGIINLVTLKTAPTLQVAEVSIIETSNCDNLLRLKHNRHWKGVSQHQVCAGHLAGGVDTCQGDSGGPLQYLIGEKFGSFRHPFSWALHRIVAVTSFGYGCARANTPGVYTRVASFMDWIESIVWPDDYNNSARMIFPD